MLKYIWRDKKQLIIIIGVILVCSIAIAIGIYAQITNTKINKTAEEKREANYEDLKNNFDSIFTNTINKDGAAQVANANINYDEIIFTAPDGETFNQPMANRMSMLNNIIILCGHYKGIDQRVRDTLITKEISIGDYVLTGGEMAAAIITDAIVRVIPGAIGDEQSALSDSFQDNLLSPPVYTRPSDYRGMKVPEILLSGNERKISEWEHEISLERTAKLRPDLLK